MRVVWVLLLFSWRASADDPGYKWNPYPDPLHENRDYHVYSSDEAFNITVEAAQKRPDVALLLKNGEQWFWKQVNHVGLTKDIVVPIASVAAPLVAKKVSTRTLHMDWRPVPDLTLRPDFDYYYLTRGYQVSFTLTWRF